MAKIPGWIFDPPFDGVTSKNIPEKIAHIPPTQPKRYNTGWLRINPTSDPIVIVTNARSKLVYNVVVVVKATRKNQARRTEQQCVHCSYHFFTMERDVSTSK